MARKVIPITEQFNTSWRIEGEFLGRSVRQDPASLEASLEADSEAAMAGYFRLIGMSGKGRSNRGRTLAMAGMSGTSARLGTIRLRVRRRGSAAFCRRG